ncbi:MAG: hypothetical protein ACRCVD_02520, partial [Halioglobus sp.]
MAEQVFPPAQFPLELPALGRLPAQSQQVLLDWESAGESASALQPLASVRRVVQVPGLPRAIPELVSARLGSQQALALL